MGGDTPVEQTCFPAALRSPLTHSDVQPRSHRQRSSCSRSGPEHCSECTFIFIKRCQKHDPPHFETHLFSKYLLRCPVGQAQGQALLTRQGTDRRPPSSLTGPGIECNGGGNCPLSPLSATNWVQLYTSEVVLSSAAQCRRLGTLGAA